MNISPVAVNALVHLCIALITQLRSMEHAVWPKLHVKFLAHDARTRQCQILVSPFAFHLLFKKIYPCCSYSFRKQMRDYSEKAFLGHVSTPFHGSGNFFQYNFKELTGLQDMFCDVMCL